MAIVTTMPSNSLPNLKCKLLYFIIGFAQIIDGICWTFTLGKYFPKLNLKISILLARERKKAYEYAKI